MAKEKKDILLYIWKGPCRALAEKTKWWEQLWNCQNQLGSHSNGPWDRCQLLGLAQQWHWWWAGVEFWVYFLTASLKYKFTCHTIPPLIMLIQRFLVQAQACATITTINFRPFSSSQKKSHTLQLSYTPPAHSSQPLDNYLLLQICLFWTFHRNGII